VAQASHKEYSAVGQSLIPSVIHIAAVKHQDGAWSKLKFPCYFHFASFACGDHRIARRPRARVLLGYAGTQNPSKRPDLQQSAGTNAG